MLSNLRTGRGERRGTGWQGYPSLDVLFLHVHWECVFLRVSLWVCVCLSQTEWLGIQLVNSIVFWLCFTPVCVSPFIFLQCISHWPRPPLQVWERERASERENKNSGWGLKHKSIVEGGVEGNEWISRGSLVILIKNKLLMLRRDSCATVAGF